MKQLDIVSMTPILKGWSEDKKYHCVDKEGQEVLLRISPIEYLESRRHLFQVLQNITVLDVPMCKPIALEVLDDGVATYHTWIKGDDAVFDSHIS